MIKHLRGTTRQANATVFKQLFKLRHRIFIGGRKWSLPCKDGMDIDQYDVSEAVYFFRTATDGTVDCHVRLTPTTKYSLLADYFPHLVEGDQNARGETIYEATRYIVLPAKRSAEANRRAKAELLVEMLEWAESNGVTHIQTVIDTATFASFLEMTSETQVLGLSHPFGGGPDVAGGGECMAIRWPVNRKVIHDLRTYGGLSCADCGKCQPSRAQSAA